MDYNCEKNVVSNLWKGRVMAGVSVLQRTNIWCYFKGRAGTRIFSSLKQFLPSSVKRLIGFKFRCFLPSEITVELLRGYCCQTDLAAAFPSLSVWVGVDKGYRSLQFLKPGTGLTTSADPAHNHPALYLWPGARRVFAPYLHSYYFKPSHKSPGRFSLSQLTQAPAARASAMSYILQHAIWCCHVFLGESQYIQEQV